MNRLQKAGLLFATFVVSWSVAIIFAATSDGSTDALEVVLNFMSAGMVAYGAAAAIVAFLMLLGTVTTDKTGDFL